MDEEAGAVVADASRLHQDKLHLWDFLLACNSATTEQDFRGKIYPNLKAILPHEALACLTIRASDLRVDRRLSLGFPDCYVHSLIGRDGRISSIAAQRWLKTRRPVCVGIDPHDDEQSLPLTTREPAADPIGRKYLLGHGVASPGRAWVTYFEVAGVERWSASSCRIMEMAVPHLQSALTTVDFFSRTTPEVSLSDREKEVLTWICLGKSNSQIAHILEISAWTVKIHVGNILSKLSAANRSHAIVRAIEYGIVEL
jgi:DNA-binding CsgD family transcriptional regulator